MLATDDDVIQWDYDSKGFPILAKSKYSYTGINRVGGYKGQRWIITLSYLDIYDNYYEQIHDAIVLPIKNESGKYSLNIFKNPTTTFMTKNIKRIRFVNWR